MPHKDDERRPQRKRRTRSHVLADLSFNHLQRAVLLSGHIVLEPADDYGVDAIMFHYARNGEIENGEVRIQLKATDTLKVINRGTEISFAIRIGDLHYWAGEIYPFYLVVYGAKDNEAYWLDVQRYVELNPEVVDVARQSVNVHIPVVNRLTVQTVRAFRRKSLAFVDAIRRQGGLQDVKRKPK